MEMEAKTAGVIPRNAEFFQDHFPEFPVLPGVLALDILKQAVERCLDKNWTLTAIRNVKFSSYLRPGDTWESEVKCAPGNEAEKTEWTARLYHEGRPAVMAKMVFERK